MNRLALELKSDSAVRVEDQRQSREDLMRGMGPAWRSRMEVPHGGLQFMGGHEWQLIGLLNSIQQEMGRRYKRFKIPSRSDLQ